MRRRKERAVWGRWDMSDEYDLGIVDAKKKVVADTERGILENLLGKYIEPWEREVV
jgi:hypothetical protein